MAYLIFGTVSVLFGICHMEDPDCGRLSTLEVYPETWRGPSWYPCELLLTCERMSKTQENWQYPVPWIQCCNYDVWLIDGKGAIVS